MADDNLSAPAEPVVTTPPPTETQLIEDISNLLDDPATDPVKEPEDDEAASAEPEDDPLGLDDDAEVVETDDAEEPDGSDAEIKGGRFAPHTAKVTLDDGTVTTVADLVRNNLFQRDYTKKTTELKAEKEAVDARKSEVDQRAQSLDEFQEYATWYAQHLPQQPTPPADPNDYVAWHNFRLAQDEWNTHVQAYQAFQQRKSAEEQRKAGETEQQANARYKREALALLEAMPVLKDPAKGPAAWQALKSGAREHYGIESEEVDALRDHRQLKVLRDALAYRRIKAKAPQVQAQVAQKPVKTGRRQPPQSADTKGRQARSERLRSERSFEAGVAALQDFDL